SCLPPRMARSGAQRPLSARGRPAESPPGESPGLAPLAGGRATKPRQGGEGDAMWRPRPSQLRETARARGRINDGGGPRRLRLIRVGRPEGLFLPSSETTVEVETVSGKVVRLTPELPVPFFYAWAYRIARGLGRPLA